MTQKGGYFKSLFVIPSIEPPKPVNLGLRLSLDGQEILVSEMEFAVGVIDKSLEVEIIEKRLGGCIQAVTNELMDSIRKKEVREKLKEWKNGTI